jgi:hypothetical protein
LIRNSLSFVSWKDRKAILPSIKAINHAENADAALLRLEEFEAEWAKRYPAIGQAWRRASRSGMAISDCMDGRDGPICYPVRRALCRLTPQTSHRDALTQKF